VDTAFEVGQMKIGRKLAMKLLNAAKFILAGDRREGAISEPLDRGMLINLATLVSEATGDLDQYDYARALGRIEAFFWDFCDNYVEAAKSRRYGDFGAEAAASASVAMRTALSVMLRLLAPYLAFTTEEVWSWSEQGSVHRAPWPSVRDIQALSGEDAEARRAHASLGAALGAIRREKAEQKVSVGTPVMAVEYLGAADEIRALRLVERDLKAAARTTALTLTAEDSADRFGARVTLNPAGVP
jgi:valyl-tRNA synthetase